MVTPELIAEPSWRTVDFISDLHLQASEAATFNAWRHYMQTTPADAVFILGDLFEVWVGDDALQPASFEAQCAQVIQETSARVPTFFMHGNRDFLVGQALMQACGSTLLADPTVLVFSGQRWLLSHGDELCIADTAYMAFRQQVRSQAWQQMFLAKPLAERQAIARGLRQQSEAAKKSALDYADLDSALTTAWLRAANATKLIHGHTHKPREHTLPDGLQRVVLSDWDAQATPPRAEVLRLTASALQRIAAL
jgi:UDP-2,3-diacylglucosamine hydrolase